MLHLHGRRTTDGGVIVLLHPHEEGSPDGTTRNPDDTSSVANCPRNEVTEMTEEIVTRKDAEPILKAFQAAGYKPKLVGSVAKKGRSSHDIDIVVPFIAEGIVNDPMEFPEYAKYHETMKNLGFDLKWEGKVYGREHDEIEVETWQKGGMIVDIYPRALEPGIDIPKKRTSKKRTSRKTPTTLRGVR